ncbi:MAG: response regulator [Blastocatellia bacterium]|nr:response regulator [Blastocatellia bacterium]
MSYKILLADDSVTVQKIITLTFSDEGVDVLTVNNGDEAIHRLQYLRPALVMADVSIPGKNGYEICEFVKNHSDLKNTPVILLVPAFEPFDEERARRVGADYHLTKPFQSIRTLIATVKSLIEPGEAQPAAAVAPAEPVRTETKSAKIEELLRTATTTANGAGQAEELEPLTEIVLVSPAALDEPEPLSELV